MSGDALTLQNKAYSARPKLEGALGGGGVARGTRW